MSKQKYLNLIKFLINIGLLIIIGVIFSVVLINILNIYKKSETKTNLFHDSLTLIDHIGTDFKFIDNSFNPWTNLVFNEQFVLLPRLKNSFWFYKKGAQGESYKVSYYLNGSGELLRNGKIIAGNIDRLSLILRKNNKTNSHILFISLNLSKEVSSTQNITLNINNSIKEMTINIISAPVDTPVPLKLR